MNPIDQVNTFRTANPTARVWVEEILIRGGPDQPSNFGLIQGAHFVLGIESTDIFGATTRQLTPPFAAALVPTDNVTAFGALLGINTIMQQRTIDSLTQQVADLTAAGQAKDEQIAALTVQLQAAQEVS